MARSFFYNCIPVYRYIPFSMNSNFAHSFMTDKPPSISKLACLIVYPQSLFLLIPNLYFCLSPIFLCLSKIFIFVYPQSLFLLIPNLYFCLSPIFLCLSKIFIFVYPQSLFLLIPNLYFCSSPIFLCLSPIFIFVYPQSLFLFCLIFISLPQTVLLVLEDRWNVPKWSKRVQRGPKWWSQVFLTI